MNNLLHHTMIKYARLKQQFNITEMQKEVLQLEAALWKPHYNNSQYTGSWTTLPLRSMNGEIYNSISLHASAMQKGMLYQDTVLLNNCPYLKSAIAFFDCEKNSVRLMKLNAGAVIKEHADHEMNLEEGEARFHIPIITNENVNFYLEDERVCMKEGECWYLNLSLKHSVTNSGETDRVHLVIDCNVNDAIKSLLQDEVEQKKEFDNSMPFKKHSAADKIRIIQQLRSMGTATAGEMADKMENNDD